MTQPLALIVYENLLPGTQIVNRMQDLNYRVQALNDPQALMSSAEQQKPMLVIADLGANPDRMRGILKDLRRNPATQHLPVIAFCPDSQLKEADSQVPEGVTLLVGATAVLNHLPQLLERALQVE